MRNEWFKWRPDLTFHLKNCFLPSPFRLPLQNIFIPQVTTWNQQNMITFMTSISVIFAPKLATRSLLMSKLSFPMLIPWVVMCEMCVLHFHVGLFIIIRILYNFKSNLQTNSTVNKYQSFFRNLEKKYYQ